MGHYRKNLLTVLMTERCNLRCRYCYVNGPVGRSINVRFAKRGIEDFFEGGGDAIRFFGAGEPTLEFNKMIEIHRHAADVLGRKPFTEVQTNGFFGVPVLKWLVENADMTWISCDGPPGIQDFHRPTLTGKNSSLTVEKTIMTLAANHAKTGIRSTISAHNIDRQEEMIDYFCDMGVRYVFADHMCAPVGNGDRSTGLTAVDPMAYARAFLRAKSYADRLGVFYSNFLMVNFDEPVSVACRSGLPVPHLTPSGLVTCCDMATDETGGPMDQLIYGRYDHDKDVIHYDREAIERIRTRRAEAIPACQACEIRDHCAGGCVGEALNETGDFYGVKSRLCEAARLLARELGVNYDKPFPVLHP